MSNAYEIQTRKKVKWNLKAYVVIVFFTCCPSADDVSDITVYCVGVSPTAICEVRYNGYSSFFDCEVAASTNSLTISVLTCLVDQLIRWIPFLETYS